MITARDVGTQHQRDALPAGCAGGTGRVTVGASPEVTVGIPTYNRAARLDEAIAAVVSQDYPALKVVVSDNGSTDDTPAVCERWARADPRVSSIRHEVNRGMPWNVTFVASMSTSPFFMWHADDDAVGPGYLRACVDALLADHTAVIAGGRCLLVEDAGHIRESEPTHHVADDPCARVIDYYATLSTSGGFYAVWRRSALDRALPMDSVLGGDWFVMTRGAAQGRIVHVPSVTYQRRRDGMSRTFDHLVATLGVPRWQAKAPAVALARNTFLATASRRSMLECSLTERVCCARRAARIVYERHRAADDPRVALLTLMEAFRARIGR
jgi:hypothetical protein